MTTDLDLDLAEAIEERAAILELEAGLPRDLAEDVAFLNVCAEWGLGCIGGQAPFSRLVGQRENAEAERTNRFLRDNPSLANDEFIQWLLLVPYTEPTVHEAAPLDFPTGGQDDPKWWAQVVSGDVRHAAPVPSA